MTSHTVGIVTTTYGYDLADQLISETRLGYVASYTYDANGNRATRTVNGQTETYVNDAADKLTSISIGGNTVRSFTYDGRGRRKTDTYAGSTTTYSWDAESRLTSLARPGVTTSSFGYNGLDARVSKTDSTGTFSFKRNGAGVTDPVLSDGAATYTPGISERRAGSSKFLHSGMKNADAQSGASANVDSSRTYDAFGNLTGSVGTWSGPFGYAGGFGYQEDPDHGLRLLGHRYYDSSTGRFISKDPIGDGRNWYGYAENRPLCCADANGLCSGCVNGGVAAELAATFGGGTCAQAPTAVGAVAIDAATAATAAARAAQLAINVGRGKKSFSAFLAMFGLTPSMLLRELTLEVILATGESVIVRADVARPMSSDTIEVWELKNGPHARMTKNQRVGYPAMRQGATVIVRSSKLLGMPFGIRKGAKVKVAVRELWLNLDQLRATSGWRSPGPGFVR